MLKMELLAKRALKKKKMKTSRKVAKMESAPVRRWRYSRRKSYPVRPNQSLVPSLWSGVGNDTI